MAGYALTIEVALIWLCTTGVSRADMEQNMREAIELHPEGLRQKGYEVP